MKLVVIESPYACDVAENERYLRACLRDSLLRGEAPYASHGLYTQPGVLDDTIPAEREQGIQAGFAWRQAAELTVVYQDRGITNGMAYGIADARKRGCPIEFRELGGEWKRPGDNGLRPRAEDAPPIFNGGTRCDMDRGPCACGAWHTEKDRP